MSCDPILEMRLSQADLKAMFERNRQLAQLNSGYHMGYAETKSIPTDAKPSKFRNVKVEYEGMVFDSGHELKCWQLLKWRERAGEISMLERQISFDLNAMGGEKIGILTVDFTWWENGQTVIADAKSEITRKETAYRLRKRIFEAQYAPLVIREL